MRGLSAARRGPGAHVQAALHLAGVRAPGRLFPVLRLGGRPLLSAAGRARGGGRPSVPAPCPGAGRAAALHSFAFPVSMGDPDPSLGSGGGCSVQERKDALTSLSVASCPLTLQTLLWLGRLRSAEFVRWDLGGRRGKCVLEGWPRPSGRGSNGGIERDAGRRGVPLDGRWL